MPVNIAQAVLELTKHLWGSQQGGSVRQAQRGSGDWNPTMAFALPNRVKELLAPHLPQRAHTLVRSSRGRRRAHSRSTRRCVR